MTLRDLVSLYAAIARGGTAVALSDGVGEAAATRSPGAPVLSPTAAWYVSDILAGVPPPLNGSPGRIAYKTGTSYGYRDAWAVGFDGAHVVGVWVGRPDGTPVPGLSGIVSAAPVLFEAFDRIGPKRVALRRAAAGRAHGVVDRRRCRRRCAASATPARRPSSRDRTIPRSPIRSTASRSISASPRAIRRRSSSRSATARRPSPCSSMACPIARTPFARSETWQPDGPGFVTLSVVDRDGKSDRVTVRVE